MSSHPFKTSYYDYVLPKNLIAQYPTAKRDESRLLVLHKKNSEIEHRKFHEITEYLNCGDVLVL
ncbi:MAG: S-adenosylmethionine:tRNA ribosyltransferase-isomerase, partial [Candidatus Scalindua sediminis]